MLNTGSELVRFVAILCAGFVAVQQFCMNRPSSFSPSPLIQATVKTTTAAAAADTAPTSPIQQVVVVEEGDENDAITTTTAVTKTANNTTTKTTSARRPPVPAVPPPSPSSLSSSVVAAEAKPDLDSLEELFYQTHYEFMKTVPKNQYLLWEGRKQFRQFTNRFQDDIYVVSKDYDYSTMTMTTTTPFPLNTEDRRIVSFPHWFPGFCLAAQIFHNYRNQPNARPWPHVTLLHFHEDTGGLTGTVAGKTTPRAHIASKWNKMGCSQKFLLDYLDHPDTLLVVASQHHVFDHPKAYSIPLGVRFEEQVDAAYNLLRSTNYTATLRRRRPNWIMMSHNPGNFRINSDRFASTMIVKTVFRKHAGIQIENRIRPTQEYFEDMSRSTFILSPPGAGWDCYRTWEALVVGCIPIVEHNHRKDGMYRNYQDLPIAWIDSLQNLTPEWLQAEYVRLMERPPNTYQWEKLTKQYWYDLILSRFQKANLKLKTTTTSSATTTN